MQLPEWAPNIHPLTVHFPLVLLLAAIMFDSAGLFLKRPNFLEKASVVLYILGTISIIITLYTGEAADESLTIPALIEPHVEMHEEWAERTVWFFIIYTAARLLIFFFLKPLRKMFLVPIVLIGFIGVYFLYKTGDHGAELVYGYGLGTGTYSGQMPAHNTAEE